jgi:hypothetical protein
LVPGDLVFWFLVFLCLPCVFQAKGFGEFQVTPSGDWLKMVGPVSAVNEALQTEVMLWTNVAMKKSVWRSVVPYSVPETIAPLIDFIIGVHHFPAEKKSLFFAPEGFFWKGIICFDDFFAKTLVRLVLAIFALAITLRTFPRAV